MLLSDLKKYCLQYLEQSDDTDVMSSTITELEDDDTFAEYLLNMDHCIYMGIVRMATSKILPLQEKELIKNVSYLTVDGTSTGKRLFHKIKEVYGVDEDGNMLPNVPYKIIGSKIFLTNYSDLYSYFVVYHPTVHDLHWYADEQNIDDYNDLDLNNIDGNGLNVPDEMAINIKYLVYSDMKVEESADMANLNKNYFESFLSEMSTNQVQNNQLEIITREWGDTMADDSDANEYTGYKNPLNT